MNLKDMIEDYRTKGVKYEKLRDLGNFYSGLSGKNKNDFLKGNSKYITYKGIFNNISIDLNSANNSVYILEDENQTFLQKGENNVF